MAGEWDRREGHDMCVSRELRVGIWNYEWGHAQRVGHFTFSHQPSTPPPSMSLSLTHPTVGNVVLPEVVDREHAGKPDGSPLDLIRPVGHERHIVDVWPDRQGSGVDLCVMVGYGDETRDDT